MCKIIITDIPVPITAASHVMPYNGGFIFALSYESGSVTVYKLSRDDTLCLYDLRQANIFARILSFTPALLRLIEIINFTKIIFCIVLARKLTYLSYFNF